MPLFVFEFGCLAGVWFPYLSEHYQAKDIQTVRDNEAESEILTKAVANGLQKAVRT